MEMIKSFKHKGLQQLFEFGSTKGINAQHKEKLRQQLAIIDSALETDDIDLPGYRLHQLKGKRKDIWSITVNGNWRVTFQFENGDALSLIHI